MTRPTGRPPRLYHVDAPVYLAPYATWCLFIPFSICLSVSLWIFLNLLLSLYPSKPLCLSLSLILSLSLTLSVSDSSQLSASLYLLSLCVCLSVSTEWNCKINTIQVKGSQSYSHSTDPSQHTHGQDAVTPRQRQMHTRQPYRDVCPSPPSPPPRSGDIFNFLWVGRRAPPTPRSGLGDVHGAAMPQQEVGFPDTQTAADMVTR